MKTIALLAGMTPDVTALYYNIINQHVRAKLGGRHSAKLYIYSVDLEEQLSRVQSGQWDAFAEEYTKALQPLVSQQPASIDGAALCAIVAHKVSSQVARSLPSDVAFIDVADSVARALKALNVVKVGLVGPAVTMTDRAEDFFVGKLTGRHGIEVLVPETDAEVAEVNRGMFEEVARGAAAVSEDTTQMFKDTARKLIARGAQAIILGSTDLGFVLTAEDFPGIPVLDAAKLHAIDLAEWAMAG
jgi:aspartate racemase